MRKVVELGSVDFRGLIADVYTDIEEEASEIAVDIYNTVGEEIEKEIEKIISDGITEKEEVWNIISQTQLYKDLEEKVKEEIAKRFEDIYNSILEENDADSMIAYTYDPETGKTEELRFSTAEQFSSFVLERNKELFDYIMSEVDGAIDYELDKRLGAKRKPKI